ncbi:hypothetical protein QQS21_009735 [Conoideocrella luteorostrata]|uniref:YMC020W-like alpha/beta hydrolase domain-containing protein n=1 Tax=Conoideocrella luteorostrata TaxID=1105319 RepID=A0AAJ0CGN2_9HYPO|nr:hypothetical protein QQS21_009735 [Conoideocrella luteorostrata]
MLPRKRQRPNPAEASSANLPTAALCSDIATAVTSRTTRTATASTKSLTPMPLPLPVSRASTSASTRPATSISTSTSTSSSTTRANTSQHAAASEAVNRQVHPQQPPMPPTNPTAGHGAAPPDPINPKQVRKAKSWYGQWQKTPRKASASTSLARENILGGTVRSTAAPDLSRFDSSKTNIAETGSIHSTLHSVSLPKVPENGGMSASGAATDGTVDDKKDDIVQSQKPTVENKHTSQAVNREDQEEAITKSSAVQQGTDHPAGWLGWWSKTTPTTEQQDISAPTKPNDDTVNRPVTPPQQVAPPNFVPRDPPPSAPAASSTWFGFWSSSAEDKMIKRDPEKDVKPEGDKPQEQEDVTMQDAPASAPGPGPEPEPTPKAGSTWAFWSRASPSKTSNKNSTPESGEMAVIGEGSEAQPRRVNEGQVAPPQGKDSKQGAQSKDAQPQTKSTWRKKKRVRPPSLDAAADSDASTATGTTTPANQAPQGLPAPPREQRPQTPATKAESSSNSIAESETASKHPPNLLLPSFSSTYQMKENPSILQQITQLLLRTSQPPANHVFRAKDPPKIRKAIAIGVHGLFPAMYLRPMIGQPTGTSLRFANLCAEAIRRWTDAHGSPDCEIEKVALEGEGRVSDRVDNLWKLMLNWIDHIRKADFIIMACHSQGVPVSIMLLEKLIDMGIITNAKIGVCAMAGVALGPFPDYKSSILMGSAAELWDFGNPQSTNSQRFEASLKRVLDHGARVTFIGSIDDQLVPMESAVYSPASHPYIYRAAFIDGRVHAPDFIAHLVGFALKLRNLGVTDHGLIRELSIALAGSLYSGEGHSRLYYDPAVYDLAISHALETTSTPSPVSCEVGPRDGLTSANPYVLPWIMRGMLEEDFVKTELSSETEELLRQFDDWKPSNKALKDVKYRLEAVRSKL